MGESNNVIDDHRRRHQAPRGLQGVCDPRADKSYKPTLRKLYSLWDTYTAKYLEETMTSPYIMLSNPSRLGAGRLQPGFGLGGHSQIRIRLNPARVGAAGNAAANP